MFYYCAEFGGDEDKGLESVDVAAGDGDESPERKEEEKISQLGQLQVLQ